MQCDIKAYTPNELKKNINAAQYGNFGYALVSYNSLVFATHDVPQLCPEQKNSLKNQSCLLTVTAVSLTTPVAELP